MKQKENLLKDFLLKGHLLFMPGVSVDNVIFGFHENQLKVLLLQANTRKFWMLPGGFVQKNEHIDEAAARVLQTRTGLDNIFLQQFHTFGQPRRSSNKALIETFHSLEVPFDEDHWLLQRFVSIGYYALVEYEKVHPQPDELSRACTWHDLDKLPSLLLDHKEIIMKALEEVRLRLNYQPVGYNLLPEQFTMKNLQSIYETLLGRELDRANFSRKILSFGILDRKRKHFTGGAHKAPFLYSFNRKKYFRALEKGLGRDF